MPRDLRRIAVLGVLVVSVALGVRAVSAGAAPGRSGAPCTRPALQAGLGRGAEPVARAHIGHPFGCADGWAYAAVDTSRVTLTSLFRARAGRWFTVTRGRPCARGEVPQVIRRAACDSN